MSEQLCLQWSDFKDNIISSFGILRTENDFTDVTLVSGDGHQVDSHKVVLSGGSPVFKNILKGNKHSHPLIYMRGLKSDDLFAILDFLYSGEANIPQENLESFLATAEELQVMGLAGDANHKEVEQREEPEIKVPDIAESIFKKEDGLPNPVAMPKTSKLPPGKSESATNIPTPSLALPKDISGKIEKLDQHINSMMENIFPRKNTHGLTLYACKVCGKEDSKSHMKSHIESRHLEGVSIHCKFCEMTFR